MRINVTPGKVRELLQNLGRITAQDKILADELTQEEIKAITDLFKPWSADESVTVNMLRVYEGNLYQCIQPHITQADWTPDIVPALWVIKSAPGVIDEWEQRPAENPYMTGDQVTFEGHIWESTIDNNVWSPTAYPAGWQDMGEI